MIQKVKTMIVQTSPHTNHKIELVLIIIKNNYYGRDQTYRFYLGFTKTNILEASVLHMSGQRIRRRSLTDLFPSKFLGWSIQLVVDTLVCDDLIVIQSMHAFLQARELISHGGAVILIL